MLTRLTVRALDPEVDWTFFHERAAVPEIDRARIYRLDQPSSQLVWDMVVGPDVSATVSVTDGWLSELSSSGEPFAWHEAWNAGDDEWAATTLRGRLQWPDQMTVLFLWGQTHAVMTSFDVFIRRWRAFLFDDEGPLLLSGTSHEVVWFWPTGGGRIGRRP